MKQVLRGVEAGVVLLGLDIKISTKPHTLRAAPQYYEYILVFTVPYIANQATTIGQSDGESERDETNMVDKTSLSLTLRHP